MRVERYGMLALLICCPAILAAFFTKLPAPAISDVGPFVSSVKLPSGSQSDVGSSVSHLFFVVSVAGLLALLIEIPKFMLAKRFKGAVAYPLLLLLQVVLIADCVRSKAEDWWTYGLHLANVRLIHSLTWNEKTWPYDNQLPYATLGLSMLTVLALSQQHREESQGANASNSG